MIREILSKISSTHFTKISLLLFLWGINIFCFSDYGLESYRFHIFNEGVAGLKHNKPFYYTLKFLNGDIQGLKAAGVDENLEEWSLYYGKKVSKKDISAVLYDGYYYGSIDENNGAINTTGLMDNNPSFNRIKSLNESAFQYMMFAKRCEYFLKNDLVDRYQWMTAEEEERYKNEEIRNIDVRTKLLAEVTKLLPEIKDPFLRTRYAYQAIVLSRYNEEYALTADLYKKYIEKNTQKSVINYWAMLHYAEKCVKETTKRDFLLAQVYKNAVAKKYRTYLLFEHSNPEKLLSIAKTNEEKSAIWAQEGVHNPGRALNVLEALYKLNPNDREIAFLLAREINKIEHWLYTNKVTNESLDYYDYIKETDVKQNYLDDKKYAQTVTTWVSRIVSENKITDKAFWNLALGHLYMLDENIPAAVEKLGTALKSNPDSEQYRQIKTSRMLCFVLDKNSTNVTEEKLYQDIIDLMNMDVKTKRTWYVDEADMEMARNYSATDQILTLIAYKFEQNKETAKAALILSHCKDLLRIQEKFITFWNHYEDYFFYLDEKASAQEVRYILDLIDKSGKTNFENFLVSKAVYDKYKLMDLYGTIFLREEKLTDAATVWNKIPRDYWNSGIFQYDYYMASNPFYADFYSGHAMTQADTVVYNKAEILNKIIALKTSAEKGQDVARNYFLLGNAAFNMSHHGNSWMMVRYGWSTHEIANDEVFIPRSDEKNYYGLEKAIGYYKKAAQASKDKNFAALCLRMAIKCDEYKEMTKGPRTYGQEQEVYKSAMRSDLKRDYPGVYDELLNDCGSFYKYMN